MRRLKLTPLQRDILWMLEEAGEEEMSCIRSTIVTPDETEFIRQIGALERLGLVSQSIAPHTNLPSLILTPEGRHALTR
ncbi:MAG: hypothetical protein U0790_08780 [Isosphaeraceae bacterium]